MRISVRIKLISALHLGSGQGDVALDAEVVHDEYGLPYFPAKRLKGLLYESACEVLEMSEIYGHPLFSKQELEELFQHGTSGDLQLVIHNFYLPEYDELRKGWRFLQRQYGAVITPAEVLADYTSVRYQTKIGADGTAADTSLRNIRVVDSGNVFEGDIEIINGQERHKEILALACRNLHYAGGKRNRGFGRIVCTFADIDKCILQALKEA